MDIKSYEIDSVIETLQKMGLKGLMEYTDVFVINHLLERGVINNPTDSGNVSPLVICNIDTNRWSITWNNYVELTTPQQSYIVDKVKDLSKMRWLS